MMVILDQFKLYIRSGIALAIVALSLMCWYQYGKIGQLNKDVLKLELSVSTKSGLLDSCYASIETFNKAQEDISNNAKIAVDEAKKSSKGNYESSHQFGSEIPKTKDDYKNTTDLFNLYIAKRQAEKVERVQK